MRKWVVKRDGPQGIRHQARIRVPDPAGKAGYRELTRTFDKKGDAKRWLSETEAAAVRGTLVLPDSATVGDLLELWLTSVAKGRVRAATWDDYATTVRKHLAPGLGSHKVQGLSPAAIQDWYARQLAAGVGARSLQLCHLRLRQALQSAVHWGMIAVNPCDRVTPPRAAPQRFEVWTPEQGTAFLAALEGDRLHPLYVLALSTGMRQGELLGLRWRDIDWEGRQVSVRQQLAQVRGQGLLLEEPKTAAARRSIALPAEAVTALRHRKVRQAEDRLRSSRWQDLDLVFTTGAGTPISAANLSRYWAADLKQAPVPAIRFHDLRHSHATWLLQAGVPVKVVSERLGHATIGITLQTYAHVLPGMQERAAEVMQDVLWGAR